jgi:hydroxyacylglutathione hydrolase
MKPLLSDVYMFDAFPANVFNVYFMGDVVLDAATRYASSRIFRQLQGLVIEGHALTHAHPDHQGASHVLCDALHIPFWVGAADADAAESGDLSHVMADGPMGAIARNLFGGHGHPVARRLKEGDLVGGFTVIETPGPSPGHVSYFRESDRVLMAGDVVFNLNPYTGNEGLQLPPDQLTMNPAQNLASVRKLAALRPEFVCFGHGPVLAEGEKFSAFVAAL